jgi:hypothetical protein
MSSDFLPLIGAYANGYTIIVTILFLITMRQRNVSVVKYDDEEIGRSKPHEVESARYPSTFVSFTTVFEASEAECRFRLNGCGS